MDDLNAKHKILEKAFKSGIKAQKSLKSRWIWLYLIIFCTMGVITLGMIFKPTPQSPTPQAITKITDQDIEKVLQENRLYIYQMAFNKKDCSLLSRDHQDYHSLVASRERFSNTDCGDVRAYINDLGVTKVITVISPSIESCRCQVTYLKNKPKLDPKKNEFSNNDLQ